MGAAAQSCPFIQIAENVSFEPTLINAVSSPKIMYNFSIEFLELAVSVLSHSKSFLCALWENSENNVRSALRINHAGASSELSEWDVRNDSISEHDKRHELVCSYLNAANPAVEREVAVALRPIMEAFARVAFPKHFPSGSMLGCFHRRCKQQTGTANEILTAADTTELRALLDYANSFHHVSNSAWETEVTNPAELADFAERTLRFASKS
ncbi:hypothetical protein ACMAY7_10280 [Rhodobacteraceae bacterium nBUS_24]